MTNILKQFEVSGIDSKTSKNGKNTRLRLALVYSAVIILVIVILNIATYSLYSQRLARDIFSSLEGEEHEHLTSEEFSGVIGEELLEVMLTIDIMVFVLVFGLAYFLSKQALKPLDRAYNEQKRFLSDVAHELRTPLTVMKTGLESALLKNVGENNVAIKQSVEEIDHMSSILDDLSFLIRNETMKNSKLERIDLTEILTSESEKIAIYAKAKNITVKHELGSNINILGDETEIRRLVKNLLKNAVDYNKINGEIWVNLTKKGESVVLKIKDSGIGIKDEDKEKIFDRFFKGDASRTVATSTGLGLAIVKSVVLKHHGIIAVESIPGVGTTMTVSFKMA